MDNKILEPLNTAVTSLGIQDVSTRRSSSAVQQLKKIYGSKRPVSLMKRLLCSKAQQSCRPSTYITLLWYFATGTVSSLPLKANHMISVFSLPYICGNCSHELIHHLILVSEDTVRQYCTRLSCIQRVKTSLLTYHMTCTNSVNVLKQADVRFDSIATSH